MRYKYSFNKLPIIEITLIHNNKSVTLNALVDTGADYTIFPRDVADELGININQGTLIVLEGAGRGKIVAYKHKIKIKIEKIALENVVCFSLENDLPENILGRNDLLKKFRIIFERNFFIFELV